MTAATKVVITSSPEKLPEEIRGLIDDARPLPAGTQFFEEKMTAASTLKRLGIGIVLIVIGAVLSLLGLVGLFQVLPVKFYVPLIAGAVCLFGGYLLISSLRERTRLSREQQNGVVTRYGIFLLGDLLVCRSSFDTTVIPRPFFKGLRDRAVRYELEGAPKSFDLPAEIVGRDASALDAAIEAWAKLA